MSRITTWIIIGSVAGAIIGALAYVGFWGYVISQISFGPPH